MDIELVDQGEFDLLKDEWNALLRRSAGDTVFLRWEWIHTWWSVFGGDRKLFILAARDGGRLVGLAPFYVETSGSAHARSLRLCSDELFPDALDLIIEKGREAEASRAFWARVARERHMWDAIVMEHLRPESACLACPGPSDGRGRASLETATCPYVKISGTFDEYFNSRPRLSNFSLAKKQKRLLGMGVVHKVVRTEEELAKGMDDLFFLHAKRAQDKEMETSFITEDVKEFHRRVAGLFLKEGILNLNFLSQGDAPVSAGYAFDYKDKVYFYQSGLDPEWKKLSVGSVMLALMIRRAFDDGKEEFDFLKGDEGYKAIWTDDFRREMRLTVYNGSFRAAMWRGARRTWRALGAVKRAFTPRPAGAPA